MCCLINNIMNEEIDKYVNERMPKKSYARKAKIYLRKRKRFELFWDEILITIFIIIMMLMVFINYQHNHSYKAEPVEENEPTEVDVGLGIRVGNLDSDYSISVQHHIYKPSFFF